MSDLPREIALKILYKIDVENGYSNIILDEYLNEYRKKLINRDINLISEIVYGTITWKLTLDTIISKYSKIKLKKMSGWVINILRMGAYQILFLDKVPKSAAVNESVNLSKKYAFKSTSLINAILRKIKREDYKELESNYNEKERLSKLYSFPEWLIEELLKEYPQNTVEEICKNSNKKPTTTIRVNTIKTNKEELEKIFDENDIKYEDSELPNFIYLKNVKNIAKIEMFKNGLFTIQDIGAGRVGVILNPKENEIILDACSAPGGKTTHLAEIMNNKGKIIACDIHEHRIKLVEENATRLGINIIETELKNIEKYYKEYVEKFDKILLDVPCLGIGVIKRKPDIKWKRTKEDIKSISDIQLTILKQGIKYLKPDGELVYSTCSILKKENEDVIQKFLDYTNKMKDKLSVKYILESEQKILPDKTTDGFYIAKIKKIKK